MANEIDFESGFDELALDAGLSRRNLGQQMTDLLRRMVIEGKLRVGQRLVEQRLAEGLGISRTPVREALHRLAQEELLCKRSRGGYEVRPLTPEEVEDAEGLRAVLEAYAAERAASRCGPELRAVLERNLDEFEQALADKDEERLVALNSQFHHLLHQAADSTLLSRQLGELEVTVERISRALISNMAAGSWSCDEHRAIYMAIREGSPALAAKLAREHVAHGGTWIVARMREENLAI
ncbi:transcriptional regulator, GntR family [Desulfarculus baarsii DSM 2075]|uniref:Transcriptional regulator, GntR family n=1 Tax=Desulfarculus baarsii (strain ATCC 33931 / DSM 2075 / LMG 7858 / VKM B-1802 / 2st14) TaxID=644282 RepID=E1QI94_DESB2|nr:GntR family transcriptional regulator [Desulfarculus baarsii]ADK85411.1 transcriptional regulator, GntR family [Desulfarculus baarsii DSM 2075]